MRGWRIVALVALVGIATTWSTAARQGTDGQAALTQTGGVEALLGAALHQEDVEGNLRLACWQCFTQGFGFDSAASSRDHSCRRLSPVRGVSRYARVACSRWLPPAVSGVQHERTDALDLREVRVEGKDARSSARGRGGHPDVVDRQRRSCGLQRCEDLRVEPGNVLMTGRASTAGFARNSSSSRSLRDCWRPCAKPESSSPITMAGMPIHSAASSRSATAGSPLMNWL